MKKNIPLYLDNSVIGTVNYSFDGVRAHFYAVCTKKLSYIARVYVRSGTGTLLIGVLAPDGDAFSVSKTVTKSTLSANGIDPDSISLAYTTLCRNGNANATPCTWHKPEVFPERLRCRSEISALAKSGGALTDDKDAPTRLAVPLMTGRPFPRPDLLCLMTPEEIDGGLYGIIGISKGGAPRRV